MLYLFRGIIDNASVVCNIEDDNDNTIVSITINNKDKAKKIIDVEKMLLGFFASTPVLSQMLVSILSEVAR